MAVTINGTTGITTTGDYDAEDGDKILLGTDDDLQIYHDGSNSYIEAINTGAGDLIVQGTGKKIKLRPKSGEEGVVVIDDGAVELYYDGVKKFETNQYGNKSFQHLYMDDSHKLQLGSDQDLQIYHDGSDSIIKHDGTGTLKIQTGSSQEDVMIQGGRDVYLQVGADATAETAIRCIDNGAVELYYDNAKKLHTYSEGCKLTGYIKACTDESDSHWPNDSYNWHKIANNATGQGILILEHSGDSDPYGIEMYFTDNTPDDNSHTFFYAADLSAARFRVYSDGDVWTSDSSTLSSDETLKENIVDATPKLEDLKKLKVRNFNWKSSFHSEKSKKKQLGFIAQEVEEVFPGLVTEHDIATGEPDHKHTPVMKKAIKQAWSPIIIKAMQELIAKVETLETEVNTLKTKVAALEAA